MVENAEPVAGQTTIPDSKGLGGRPDKLTIEELGKVYGDLKTYIKTTEDPTIAEFVTTNELCLDKYITKRYMSERQEFSNLIKQCIDKQEAYLLRNAGGKYNATIAIFRLKQPQHGYKDRVDSDITSNGKEIGQPISPAQAEQLLRLRAERAST